MKYLLSIFLFLVLSFSQAQVEKLEITWVDYQGLYIDDPEWFKPDTIYQIGYLITETKDYIILTDFYFIRDERVYLQYDSIPKSSIIKIWHL